jgi:hypothetical protein
MQSGYGVAVDSEGDIFTTGSGGLFQVTGSPLAETAFDGDPFDFATAIAFDPGALPFEAFAGPDGGRLVYTGNFGDTFLTLFTPAQPGDYNGDGSVDADDYTSWQIAYGSTTELAADGNGDNVIDAADYVIWRKNVSDLASSSSANATAVPEPASVLMLIGLALSAVQVRLRPLKK